MYLLPATNTLPAEIVTLPIYDVDQHLNLNVTGQSASFDPSSLTTKETKFLGSNPLQHYRYLAYVPSDIVRDSIALRGTVKCIWNNREVGVWMLSDTYTSNLPGYVAALIE